MRETHTLMGTSFIATPECTGSTYCTSLPNVPKEQVAKASGLTLKEVEAQAFPQPNADARLNASTELRQDVFSRPAQVTYRELLANGTLYPPADRGSHAELVR